jgi:predicted small secreted protein
MSRVEVRKSVLWLLLVACGFWMAGSLTACNTVEGMGEDIEDTGDAISGAAEGADD